MKKTIKIPKNTDMGTITLKGRSGMSRISIIAGEGSRATFVEEISGYGGNRNEAVEIVAKPNSEIRFAAVQRLAGGRNNASRNAVVHKNANVEWIDIVTGSTITNSETVSELAGEGAKSRMLTVFFGNKKQQFDFLNKCIHTGRNTESLILSIGALKDSSKAIQKSISKIGKKAYNSSTHQKARTILLNEGTEAMPVPELEIDNNDVTATHEAAIGMLDDEKVFYLMSRGISENEARKTIVNGFFEQIISRIEEPELREKTHGIINERMEND